MPSLFQALEERIGREVSDIQAWSTNKRSTELASLAPMIVAAAGQGDTLANSLPDSGAALCERLLSVAPDTLSVYSGPGLKAVCIWR